MLLSLDITQRCNARCPFCGYWRLKNPVELDLDTIHKVLIEAYDVGCAIAILTGGEPLLRDDLPKILRYAKQTGLLTFLLTNGYLLPERITQLHEDLDVVSVSVDFPDTRHDLNRGLKGLLNRAITGLKLAKSYGITTNVNCVITGNHTLQDIKTLLFLAKRLESGITFSPIFITENKTLPGSILGRWDSREQYNQLRVTEWNQMKSIADMLLYYKKHEFGKIIQNSDTYLRVLRDRADFTCYPLSLQIGVSSEGIVGAVCPLGIGESYDLGDVTKHRLRDIWHSAKAERLREQFKECNLTKSLGCYLLCVAEPSMPFNQPSIVLDYINRVF